MRYLNGNTPAADAFDLPRRRREIDGIVASTGFITGRPREHERAASRATRGETERVIGRGLARR